VPTSPSLGQSQEVYLLDALPAGSAHVGNVGADPPGATGTNQTPVAESDTDAAAIITATLAAAAAKKTYLCGFAVTGAGATAASVITVAVTGITGTTLNFKLVVPAGAAVSITPLIVTFPVPLAGSAVNTAIVVTVPSFGAGNAHATVTAWGYQQ
jgi:hypothetical protein